MPDWSARMLKRHQGRQKKGEQGLGHGTLSALIRSSGTDRAPQSTLPSRVIMPSALSGLTGVHPSFLHPPQARKGSASARLAPVFSVPVHGLSL